MRWTNALHANVMYGEPDESSARQTEILQARSCEWRHEKIESSLFVPVSFLPQISPLKPTALGQVRFFGSNRISKRQLSRFPHSTIFFFKAKPCSKFLSFYTLPFSHKNIRLQSLGLMPIFLSSASGFKSPFILQSIYDDLA